MTFKICGQHRSRFSNLFDLLSADKLHVRIWNLHGTVDFGLKWMILKTLTESFLMVAMRPVE